MLLAANFSHYAEKCIAFSGGLSRASVAKQQHRAVFCAGHIDVDPHRYIAVLCDSMLLFSLLSLSLNVRMSFNADAYYERVQRG